MVEKKESEIENERQGQNADICRDGLRAHFDSAWVCGVRFHQQTQANIELQTLHKEVSVQKNELFDKNKKYQPIVSRMRNDSTCASNIASVHKKN